MKFGATRTRGLIKAVPVIASMALMLAACGGADSDEANVAQEPAAAGSSTGTDDSSAKSAPATGGDDAAASGAVTAPAQPADKTTAAAAKLPVKAGTAAKPAKAAAKAGQARIAAPTTADIGGATTGVRVAGKNIHSIDTTEAERAENAKIAQQKDGATETGITKDSIKLGMVNMHGMALGNAFITPMSSGVAGVLTALNDRGGVLGRRMTIVDCDDGPGEVSRSKSCIKKLVGQDRIFTFLSYTSWATASIHDDLKQTKVPLVGSWAYSQTEWQDPYMFPTHMSMIHEAMAGANWVRNVVKPKTYGLICLTSPEMQLACSEVQKILDKSGAKLVKKADVAISETSMSSQVLAMRVANPDHIVHYVINPATLAKFVVESAQQDYYPPKGISGNHLAAEVLGSLWGKHPAGRYWTNTTYRLWGSEFMATMNKYARGNRGANNHIVQSAYVGANIFVAAAKAVGPNLTRERLMAQLGNGDVFSSDASLDQRFSYTNTERYGNNWNKAWGQGREFMYKYTSPNTTSSPDGSPSGFEPDPNQFVIYTHK